MSRSSADQVRISLAPHQVALVRLSRGRRHAVAERKVLAVAERGENGWSEAVDALGKLLSQHDVSRAGISRIDATVVLSNHFVRYMVLPWSAELIAPSQELAFARTRFVQVFGETARTWHVSLSSAPGGAARLAAAVDQPLVDALVQQVNATPLRLVSMQPALMSQFNAWRRQIGDEAWLVLAERGRVLIAWIHHGQWRSVRARPVGEDPVPLAEWIAQERMLLGAPTVPSKVCLSVVDDAAVDTQGVRVEMLSPPARDGFVPRADGVLLLAMAGAG